MSRYRKPDYAELTRYYASPYWQRTRGLLMYQRGGKCQDCGSSKRLEAHHLHYRHLFSEQSHMEDLRLLCHDCHMRHEARKPHKRKGTLGRLRDALGRYA